MPPANSAHRGLPAKNEFVRVYLVRNSYNGFSDDNKDGGEATDICQSADGAT